VSTPDLILVLVGSNLACLFLGYLGGRLTRATIRIEEQMSTEEGAPDAGAEGPDERPRPWHPGRGTLISIAGAVVVIGLVTASMGFIMSRNQDRLTACVAGYSNALADTLSATREANTDAANQLDAVFQAVLDAYDDIPAEGQERVRSAVEAHQKARAEQRKTQSSNPLPEAPRDACAELLD